MQGGGGRGVEGRGPGNSAQWQVLRAYHPHGLPESSHQSRWLLPAHFIDKETETLGGDVATSPRSRG